MFQNLLVLSVALQTVVCNHVFFHEPSAILLKPNDSGEPNPSSDFGFSMGYWNGNLIVGSPRSNFIGEVYKCPLNEITYNNLSCNAIEINATSIPYSLEINPNQHFYLGGSIATTKDYVFTCAPLVTRSIKVNDTLSVTDAVGSCFIYNGTTSIPYRGPAERYMEQTNEINLSYMEGGSGWTTRADEENGYLFIAKTSVDGNIDYLKTSNPGEIVTSIKNKLLPNDQSIFADHWNIGYAITAGKFFSNKVVYAMSMQTKKKATGVILFIEEKSQKSSSDTYLNIIHRFKNSRKKYPYIIEDPVVGAMFGYSLGSADLTEDGLSELLVGAPLQCEDINELEYGAMHVYVGEKEPWKNRRTSVNKKPKLTIIGATQRGRFGSSIAASDLDGDNIPEVFVSAPYEGSGVVYVLSGYELNSELKQTSSGSQATGHPTVIQVPKLKYTQRVTKADLNWLGFSLQVLPDLDGNGCNELAIGAPNSAKVLLLKCLQTVKVYVFTELNGMNVRIDDSQFNITACVNIEYMTGNEVSGFIHVNTEIVGDANIEKPNFKIDLSKKLSESCENIVIGDLKAGEVGDYKLTTKLILESIPSKPAVTFDKSWAKLSINSVTETFLTVSRQCRLEDDCTPHVDMTVQWTSKPHTNFLSKGIKKDDFIRNIYRVGSTPEESVSVIVKNVGLIATSGRCVKVEVVGARVANAGSCLSKGPYYACSTVATLRPGYQNEFEILLDMSSILSSTEKLTITSELYENCDRNVSVIKNDALTIEYLFDEEWEKVQIQKVSHEKLITDTELLAAQENEKHDKESTFDDVQEYLITYDGNVTWNDVNVVIEVEDTPFIEMVTTTEKDCTALNNTKIKCTLTLLPRITTKIVATVVMSGRELGDALNNKQETYTTSAIKLYRGSPESQEKKEQMLVTNIKLVMDLSFKNKPILMAIVAIIIALIFLALVTFCLYKKGFFKRDKKKKLDVLRESVRRRSIRLASDKSSRLHSQKSRSNAEGDDHIDIEVVDDSPFEEVPISSKDDVVLIESKAEIHAEDTNNHKLS